jgi:type III secretion protein V
MRDGLFHELGVLVPTVHVNADQALPENGFEIMIGTSEPIWIDGLSANEILVNDSPDALRLFGVEGRDATNPSTGAAASVVRVAGGEHLTCRAAGFTTWGRAGHLVLHLSAALRRSAAALQTDDATGYLLDALAAVAPELVKAATERYPVRRLTPVLRHLLADEISIRNLRTILESLLCLDGSSNVDLGRFIDFPSNAEPLCFDPETRAVPDLPASVLADYVRTWLKPQISHKYAGGSSSISVFLLHPDIEERFRNAASQPLTADETSRLHRAIAALPRHPSPRPVLLTNIDVRATVRAALRGEFPTLAVLSYQELTPELNISPLERISW